MAKYVGANGRSVTVTTPTGERLTVDGRRADLVAAVVIELVKRPWLDGVGVFEVSARSWPGQITIGVNEVSPPYKRAEDKEAV